MVTKAGVQRSATKRSYEDGCAAAHALDLVGERWALLVVRELILGPKRFTDLRAGLPLISPNVLSQRLDELARVAVVRRRRLPPPAGSWVYELTEWGRDLEPIIGQLGRWGARSPYLNREAKLSMDSLMLSFGNMFDPRAAAGLDMRVRLVFGDDGFVARVVGERLEIKREHDDRADVTIVADPSTLAGVVYDGHDLDDAVDSGAMKVGGDRATFERFLGLFALPDPAPAA